MILLSRRKDDFSASAPWRTPPDGEYVTPFSHVSFRVKAATCAFNMMNAAYFGILAMSRYAVSRQMPMIFRQLASRCRRFHRRDRGMAFAGGFSGGTLIYYTA